MAFGLYAQGEPVPLQPPFRCRDVVQSHAGRMGMIGWDDWAAPATSHQFHSSGGLIDLNDFKEHMHTFIQPARWVLPRTFL